MNKYAFTIAAALALALAAGSAQAGSKLGVGSDGRTGNGVRLNGMPANGFTVETVRLPDASAQAGRHSGLDRDDIQLAEVRGSPVIRGSGGRWGNGVRLNGIAPRGLTVETVALPDGSVVGSVVSR